jgi:hypothetical protein
VETTNNPIYCTKFGLWLVGLSQHLVTLFYYYILSVVNSMVKPTVQPTIQNTSTVTTNNL